ncbi:unnamed protein product [Discosporangium mesarthrocarpum]
MTGTNVGTDTLTCLRGGTIFTFDDDSNVFEDGELWLSGTKIVSAGPRGSYRPLHDRFTYVDTPGRMILPGLINAHTHSYSALLKGSVESNPLDIYMLSVIASGAAMTPREIYVSAQLDALAMLHTGVTSAIDHYSERPALSREGLSAVRSAFENIGMRATIATMFADRPYIDTIPVERSLLPPEIVDAAARQTPPDAAAYFAIMEEAVSGEEKDARVRVILGVDGPQRWSDLLMEMTGDFQQRYHCGLHTHMLETKTQAAMRPAGGPGFVRRMADLGILDENSSLVHFIWSDEDDIAAAAETGVTVVHSPGSNAMLGAGIAPVLRLRQAGIPVAFGTDGSNCGPPALLESMRMGCYLMRLTEPDFETWPDARTILEESYAAGARAVGRAGKIGVLQPGARADITVLNPVDYWHQPLGDPYRHLLYYENGSSTEHVWVDGRQVVDSGRVTTIDEEALIAEAKEIALRRQSGISSTAMAAVEAQYPAFRQMILDNFSDDIGIERRIAFD